MILAAPLVIPFAEAVGISIATLGMAKAADMVNDYIQENPEKSAMILKTLVPNLIGDLTPSINSIDVGVVLNIFDFMAFVPMSIDAIFIKRHHYISLLS